MMAGETAVYQSRGPSANNQLVPHVMANGSVGSGGASVNDTGDGWTAWLYWGGTSRSAPMAMGLASLAMDAYEQANGTYPSWYEVRQFLMQGSDHLYNTPMDAGAGVIDAGRSAGIAAGNYGVTVSPDYWDVGDFEGMRYNGGFAHITSPGDVNTFEFEINNDSTEAADVTVSDYMLEESAVYQWTMDTADISLEDGSFLKPDYLFDIEDIIGGPIPGDTVFMQFELLHPFDTYDIDGDDLGDNRWRLYGYDWLDLNGDGNLWEDTNGDSVVNWNEIDENEYAVFNRPYFYAHHLQLSISNPLGGQFNDGIYVGLRHWNSDPTVPTTTLSFQLILYRQADWDALDTSSFGGTLNMDPGESITATVAFTSPMEYGFYQGAVQVDVESVDALTMDPVEYTTIVPVFVQVAYQGNLTEEPEAIRFGDNEDADQLYSNGYVRPIQDWLQGRATAGDWRFFFFNQDENPNEPGHQTKVVARVEWDAAGPPADIDSYLLGPDYHFSAYSNDPNPVFGSSYGTPDDFWGPYALRITGMSESPGPYGYPGVGYGGRWDFQTATGTNVDYVVGDLDHGLNSIQLHSHRYDGETFREDFWVDVGYIDAPEFMEWDNYGTMPVTLTTNLTFTDPISVTSFGISQVTVVEEVNQTIEGESTNTYDACVATWHYTFTASNLLELTAMIDNFHDGDDLDLFLLYDYNGDGFFDCDTEEIGNSGSGAPDPEVITLDYPPDGDYQVAVDPYTVGADESETFDLFVTGMEISDAISVTNLDTDSFGPGDPITFDVYNQPGTCLDATESCASGLIQIWMEGEDLVPLFDIPVHPRYSRMDLGQSSVKWAEEWTVMPGDLLTYTIEIVNTDVATGTVVVTDMIPANTTLHYATPGYVEVTPGTLVWDDIDVPSGGGQVVTADYDWFDISGFGTAHTNPGEWIGYFTWNYGLPDDDEGSFYVDLPFDYPYFGGLYDYVYVDANGQVTFDYWTTYASAFFCDGLIPGYDGCYDRIAVLLGDQAGPILGDANTGLLPGGTVYTYHDDGGTAGDTADDRFIIQWDEWQVSFRAGAMEYPYPANTYQLILYPDGRAKAQYAEIVYTPPHFGGQNPADIGVEGPEGGYYTPVLEGYRWHLTPENGSAWMYEPVATGMVELDVVVQVDDPLDEWADLCNTAYLDDGFEVIELYDCAYALNADVSVQKTVDAPANPINGDMVTFTIDIDNAGPLSTTFTLTDTLDEGLVFDSIVSQSGMGTFIGADQELTGSDFLTVGEIYELVYTAIITSEVRNDMLCNDVYVESGFGALAGDSACVYVNEVNWTLTKDVDWDGFLTTGTVLTYTVEAVNTGDVASTAWITDYLPSELTFGGIIEPMDAGYDDVTHVITASFASVGPGASALLAFTATVDAGLYDGYGVCNEAEVIGDGYSWDYDYACSYVQNPFDDSWKWAPLEVVPGEMFTYTIYLVNDDSVSHMATVTDMLPAEVTVITDELAMDLTYDEVAHEVTWSGSVPPAGVELDIPVQVDWVVPGYIFNEAIIEGSGMEMAVYRMTEIMPPLELIKTVGDVVGPVGPYEGYNPWGEDNIFHYHLDVHNHSFLPAPVHISDPLPEGVVVDEASIVGPMTYDEDAHLIEADIIIPPRSAVHLDVHVYGTLEAAQDDKALFNTFYVTDDWGYEYASNMTQMHIVSTELEVVKWAEVDTATLGDEILYTVVVRNVGDHDVNGEVSLVDDLPADVTYVDGSLEIEDYGNLITSDCLLVGQSLVCDFSVNQWPETNAFIFHYAVTVDETASMGDMLVNHVSVADGWGAMTYGICAVEIVASDFIYLPLIVRD
jgi:uncharacterized repeat protein (TIGR01451 family)